MSRAFEPPVRVEALEIPVAVSIGVAVVDAPGSATRGSGSGSPLQNQLDAIQKPPGS